ncbi:MAG: L,D-transpeptidase family protein, partial [Chthoniobacteraceae bacterium]
MIAALAAAPWPVARAQVDHPEPITQVVPAVAPGASPTPAQEATPPLSPVGEGSPDVSPMPTTSVSPVASPGAAESATPSATASPSASPTPSTSASPGASASPPAATPGATPPGEPEMESKPEPTPLPTPPSPYSIEIDLSKQRAYLLDGGEIYAEAPISSGRAGHLTPRGNFEVIEKDLDHFSNLYGEFVNIDTGRVVKAGADVAMPVPKGCKFVPAPMKWFMRFDGANGMHAGYLPGFAASHGCVRMPAAKAEFFYQTVDVGTPVHV